MFELPSDILGVAILGEAWRIVVVALLALLCRQGLQLVRGRVESRLERSVVDTERLGRLRTLVRFGNGLAGALILLVAGLMALYILDINVAPLLATAGVAGLALSLGAQTLIKDYIGGILILIEDQFHVGDVIQVGDVAGGVEQITLRATCLRDIEGRLHLVPNGDIRTVSNLTAEWSRAIVDLHVDYGADMGAVARALEAAAARAQEDPAVRGDLLEPPQPLCWIGLKDWGVQVRLMAKTRPGKQWGVMMALRRYGVEALQAEGVGMALPAERRVHEDRPGQT